jgi:hypothetical protein
VVGLLPVRDKAGRIRAVRFKADRVDRIDPARGSGGSLRWTDYKTGKPFSDKKTDQRRRADFLNRVRAGTNLQGVAYLQAAEGREPGQTGRYLFLRPNAEEREFAVPFGDPDFTPAFANAVEAVLGTWDEGGFFPRLVDPKGQKEPVRCGFCAVSEACLRHDSGSRLRLFEWTVAEAAEAERTAAEAALLRVWRLPVREEAPEGQNGPGGGEGA